METRGGLRAGRRSGSMVVLFVVLMLGARMMRAQNIYVLNCEYGNGVNVFSRDGAVLKKLIPLGGMPCTGMAVDKAGHFYIGFRGNKDNVRIFDADGKYLGAWSLGIGVLGIAAANDGTIYVCGSDQTGQVVKNFNPDGSHGGLVIATRLPVGGCGITLDSERNVYLATTSGLYRYDPTGKPIGKPFFVAKDYPKAVAVAPNGNFYGAYYVPIATFSPSGERIQPTMRAELPDGMRPNPTTITVDKDGTIYVGYYTIGFHRAMIATYAPDGKQIGKYTMTGGDVMGIYVK
jgi:sugar lactone lactonase YvrE